MVTVYHNPKCRKSRAGLQYLLDKGIECQVVEYLKTPFTKPQLQDLLMKLNLQPHDIIRTQEDDYRNNLKGKAFTNEEWINIMVENPRLIQRPIVVKGYKAVIGQDPDELDKLVND